MKIISATIDPHRLDDVKTALDAFDISRMTIWNASSRDSSRETDRVEFYRGTKYLVDVSAKIRIEVLCNAFDASDVARVMAGAAQSDMGSSSIVWISDIDATIGMAAAEEEVGALSS